MAAMMLPKTTKNGTNIKDKARFLGSIISLMYKEAEVRYRPKQKPITHSAQSRVDKFGATKEARMASDPTVEETIMLSFLPEP